MTEDAEPDARTIAQFVLAELRRANDDLLRAQHQIDAIVHADDLRAALRERLLDGRVIPQRDSQRARVFPTEEDVQEAASAIWDQHYRTTSWEHAPELMRGRPLTDARAALESVRERMTRR